jgi:hypothetical protein
MKFEIEVYDYFDHNEIKSIIKDCIQSSTIQKLKDEKELNRIISNSAYDIVWKMVDDIWDNNLETILKNKVLDILTEMNQFHIFKPKNVWDREENIATKYLNQVVAEELPNIKPKIIAEVHKIGKKDLQQALKDAILEKLQKSI